METLKTAQLKSRLSLSYLPNLNRQKPLHATQNL